MAQGLDEMNAMLDAGFSSQEVEAWRQEEVNTFRSAGFSEKEIGEHFGAKYPDMAPVKSMISNNLQKVSSPTGGSVNPTAQTLPGPAPIPSDLPKDSAAPKPKAEMKEAKDIWDAIEAGFDMSVAGLVMSKPDMALAENAPMYQRIASQIGMIAGDIPAMIPGGIVGSGAGTAILGPGPGTAMGAGAGSFALPAAMRETLMQYYEKGDIKDFGDYWERTSAVFLKALQAGELGAITMGTGKIAGGALGAAAPVVRNTAVAAGEVAAMTVVGSAMEGHAPKAQDFIDGALLVGGMHLGMKGAGSVGKIAPKLRELYAKTGIKPEQVAEHSAKEPTVMQDLVSSNRDMPAAYENLGGAKPEQTAVQLKNANIKMEPFTLETKAPEAPKTLVEKTPEQTSVDNVLARIGKPNEKPSAPYTMNDFYKDFVDRNDPVKVLVEATKKGELPVDKDPYVNLRLFVDHANKARTFLEFGQMDYATQQPIKGTPSFMGVLAPFKKAGQISEFQAYVTSKRALELEASGVKTGIPIDDAKAVVAGGKKSFDASAKDFVAVQNGSLQYLGDAGFFTKAETARIIAKGEAYVPFYRLVEDAEGAVSQKGGTGKLKPVKAIKGSDAMIVDPLESAAKNIALYVKRAEQNRALRSFVEFAEQNELMGSQWIEKVSTPMKKIEVKAEEVKKLFADHNVELTAEKVAVFRPESLKLHENDVAVFRDGKMEIYRLHKDLAQAYRAMDGSPAANLLVKLLRPFASLQRTTLSVSPDFPLRNFIRDQATAGVFNKYKGIPVWDSMMAVRDIVGKSEAYEGFLRSGGGNGSFLSIDSNYIQKNIFGLNKETGFLDRAINVVRSPYDGMKIVGELMENSTRVAAYKNAVKATGKGYGELSLAENMAAGLHAREITVDFARVGAKAQAMNQITAYWNVGIQGMDRTVRAFKEDPAGASVRAVAGITLPSVLLWWANKDDPRWRELQNWEKDAFWIVMTKDTVYRIPKPMELGMIFGSLPERVLEKFFTDNPKAMKDFDKTMFNMVEQFGAIPTAAVPALEHWANKSTFTGAPVIPHRFEGLFPQYQYTERTTETAKLVGQLIGSMPGMKSKTIGSPMVIENYVRSWSGNTGMYILKALDESLTASGIVSVPPKATSTLADIPFVKAFVVRNPSANTQHIVDFEDRLKEQMMAVDSIRSLSQRGDFSAMQKELNLAVSNGDIYALKGMGTSLTRMSEAIQMINRSATMTRDEKREQIDAIYFQMNEMAKRGAEIQNDLDKALGEK